MLPFYSNSEKFYIYRYFNGFPNNIVPDLLNIMIN